MSKKLLAILCFSLSIALTVIGVHQTLTLDGIEHGYGFFAMSGFFFLLYAYLKPEAAKEADKDEPKAGDRSEKKQGSRTMRRAQTRQKKKRR